MYLRLIIFICLTLSLNAFSKSSHSQANGWELKYFKFNNTLIRSGIKKSKTLKPKGHVLYLEGLADSMLNHEKLFQAINEAGYHVVSFDYMGQGGSTGKMNNTTIASINELAKLVWDKFVKSSEKKKIIGWSTGGLAAYRYAYKYPNEVDSIILIAPGIAPKLLVGEMMKITLASLTQVDYSYENNPHVDPIRPKSPLSVPLFSMNLLYTAKLSRSWKINPKVKGHVFLSDSVDTYVNPDLTLKVLEKNASHFSSTYYENTGALHELDNETEEISSDLRQTVIDFLP